MPFPTLHLGNKLLLPATRADLPQSAHQSAARSAATVLAGTALLALCAHIALPLPFTPVPGTMQTFAVILLGMLLGPVLGPLTLVAYLLEGAAGLPVFAPTPSLTLVGPTFGYLLSFPVAAFLAGAVFRSASRALASVPAALLAGLVAFLPIFVLGATWLGIWLRLSAHTAIQVGIYPFLPGEAIKLSLAALAIASLHRLRPTR